MPQSYIQHIVADSSHVDSLSHVADSIAEIESASVYLKKIDAKTSYFAFNANIDSLLSRNFSSLDSTQTTAYSVYGFEGVPLATATENNTAVQSILLISILLSTVAFGLGTRYFVQMLKNIFKVKTRLDFSLDNSYVGFEVKSILSFQALILESLVSYVLIQNIYSPDCKKENLWIGIACFFVVFLLYHLLRLLVISTFGSVFGDSQSMKKYVSEYFSFVSLWGVLLLPVSFFLLYYHLTSSLVALLLILPAIIGRIVYFGKGIKIFLVQKRSIFYIILYLCALEIVPMLVLFEVLIYTYSVS